MSLQNLPHSIGDLRILAKEICPDTDEVIIGIVIEGYRLLYSENVVQKNWSEDMITLQLYMRIQKAWKRTKLTAIPVHQYPIFIKKKPLGRPPTIDFAFHRGFLDSSYFGFECKLVNDSDPMLIREYVGKNGMLRFISGKYATEESIGGMVGYLINSKVSVVVELINKEILNKMSNSDCLNIRTPIKGFNHAYSSTHTKSGHGTSINLNHLFFPFNC